MRIRQAAPILVVVLATLCGGDVASATPSGFPDQTSTGPSDESKVPENPVHGHVKTVSDGQVLENIHATGITVQHDDVVIRNFRVTVRNPDTFFAIRWVKKADGSWPRGILIEEGELISRDDAGRLQTSSASGIHMGRNVIVRGLDISYMQNGIHCKGNCVVENNYIHHLLKHKDSHNDGVAMDSGTGLVVRHNTILLPDQQTGTVFIIAHFGPVDDVLITGNYLNGGTYTVYSRKGDAGVVPTNVRVIDNHLGPDYVYGPRSIDGEAVWEGNFLIFQDIFDSTFYDDIVWLADAGLTKGCTGDRFCPNDYVTRAQMASFLVRALELTDGGSTDPFGDDDGNVHETDINRLLHAGITKGCGSDRFCPNDNVTRSQMAAFLHRAFDEVPRT